MKKDEQQPPAEWLENLEQGSEVKIVFAIRKNRRTTFPGHVVNITRRIIEVAPETDFEVESLSFGRKTGKGTGRFGNIRWLQPAV